MQTEEIMLFFTNLEYVLEKSFFVNLSSDDSMQDKVEHIPDTLCLILWLPLSE